MGKSCSRATQKGSGSSSWYIFVFTIAGRACLRVAFFFQSDPRDRSFDKLLDKGFAVQFVVIDVGFGLIFYEDFKRSIVGLLAPAIRAYAGFYEILAQRGGTFSSTKQFFE